MIAMCLRVPAWLCLIALAAPCSLSAQERAIDLSPRSWPEGELTRFFEMAERFGDPESFARSELGVITTTTSAPAARAGLEALRQGGSSVDAALTTALAQVVLSAGSWVSFAGILTMVHYDAETGTTHNLNAAYDIPRGEKDPSSIPASGPSGRTALVPGFLAGVEAAHERFGRLPFASLFGPAIYFAEEGFPLHALHESMIRRRADVLQRLPETRAIFTKKNGELVEAGDIFAQPTLAKTLRRVAGEGRGYFYEGEWAEHFVAAIRREGGHVQKEDLSEFQATWTQPLTIPFGDFVIHAHGLPAQGGAHLAEALNLINQAGLTELPHFTESPESFFWLSQITNLMALSFIPKSTRGLLTGGKASLLDRTSPEHAKQLWKKMKSGSFPITQAPNPKESKHSDGIVVIDRDGNITALVHSINTSSWGETGLFVDGVSIPDSASFQQLQMAEAGAGNRLPDPTEPLIVTKDGKPILGLASIGAGLHQKTVCVLLNLLAFDMGIEDAIAGPSLHLPKFSSAGKGTPQVFEGDFEGELIEGVRSLGLEVEVVSNDLSSRAPRGYVVGAILDPESGERRAMSTRVLNSPALGQE
ncbi:MAG: gamma-glutamyltransferase [Planctomycetota bacterium]